MHSCDGAVDGMGEHPVAASEAVKLFLLIVFKLDVI